MASINLSLRQRISDWIFRARFPEQPPVVLTQRRIFILPTRTGYFFAFVLILLLIAAFHHAALGLQTIAEDYIHSRARFAVIAIIQLACAAGGVAGIAATLLIALAS